MPSKYPTCRPDEVRKALERAGFQRVKQTGSHLKMSNGTRVVIIPMHQDKDLKTGTLKGILEQADMSVDEFLKYLK